MTNTLTAVAAVARNGVIGVNNQLPWHIGEDLAHFRQLTMGGALIMGRATYESLPGPLPGRVCFVMTRQSGYGRDSLNAAVVPVCSLDEALSQAQATGRPRFVVGGAQVYAAAWPRLTDLQLTLVDDEPAGDAFFPDVDLSQWHQISRTPGDGFAFVHYQRHQMDTAARQGTVSDISAGASQ